MTANRMTNRTTDDEILKEARERFQAASDAEEHNRVEMLEDLRFANGEQWPETILQSRKEEGRPTLTINKIPQFLKQVLNDQRQNRPQIKVRPVDDSADIKTAKVLNGLTKNIEEQSSADIAYDTAFESAAGIGIGYFRILTEYSDDDGFDQDIRIKRITNPFTVYCDPDSREPDGSDAKYYFVTEKLKRKVFAKQYPKATSFEESGVGESLENWYDEDAVRVAEYWRVVPYRKTIALLSDGTAIELDVDPKLITETTGLEIVRTRDVTCHKVEQYLITGREILEKKEWAGKYIPIVPVLGDELYIEGKRYLRGLIRFAKDPQRMYNYWRSATVERAALTTKAPYIGPSAAFRGHEDKWAQANTRAFSYLEYEGNTPPQRTPPADVPAGMVQETLTAADDIKAVTGIYDASLGARSNETSGKAILARQKEGDVSTFNYVDNLARAIRHAGRIIIDLIPRIYDTERVVRVLNPQGETDMVPVNQEYLDPETGKFTKFDLAMGKYDVAVDVGPSYTTQRQEAAESMMEMIRVSPESMGIIGDLMAKSMDWPNSEEIAERFKRAMPPQITGGDKGQNGEIQQQEQVQQQMQAQMQEQYQQMQAELLQQSQQAEKAILQKQLKAEADIERKKMMAELDIERQKMLAEMEIERRKMQIEQEPPSGGFFSPEETQ